jgi:hypothetical protein
MLWLMVAGRLLTSSSEPEAAMASFQEGQANAGAAQASGITSAPQTIHANTNRRNIKSTHNRRLPFRVRVEAPVIWRFIASAKRQALNLFY